MASPVSLDDVFHEAVVSFEESLTERQRLDFRRCSRREVEDTIRSIDTDLALKQKQRNMRRISKFLEGMDQLGKVVEVFVNSDSIARLFGDQSSLPCSSQELGLRHRTAFSIPTSRSATFFRVCHNTRACSAGTRTSPPPAALLLRYTGVSPESSFHLLKTKLETRFSLGIENI
ncbi:uncharacterized protein B0T15DRAFT_325410 [Chaetomium strumarium]|uniref:Uncharacterized protein n=1 Tax=Chaetomium strumarium TaxID=1170767 RepID=A0AAJ0GL13_9PEZI|nr:hypothetical protein B0T15DRAFT_325410 [Chaetomium strumarium]